MTLSIAGIGGAAGLIATKPAAVTSVAESSATPTGATFGATLQQLAAQTSDSLRASEAVSILGARGEVATMDVVEAVMKAEQSLQAAVAVRDKVVAAYLEISRMQI